MVFELVRYLDERITSPFPRFHYRYTISESKACPPEFSDPDKIVEELRTAVDTTPDGNEKAELLLDNLYSIYDSKTGRGWFFVEILYELINKMQDDDLSKFLYSDKLLGSLDTWGMLNLKDGMYEKVVSMKNKTADVVIPEYWLYLAKKIDSKEDITPEDDVILGRIGWHMYCVAFVQGDFDGAVKFFEIGGISENEKSALLDKIENRFFWSTWDREKDCLRFALKPGLPDNISFVILREMCNYRREHQEGFSPEDAWSAFISLSLNRNTPAEKVFACLRVLEYLPKDIVLEIDPRYIKKYLPYYAKQNISGKLDSEVACELIKKVIDENLEKMADKNFDLVELRLFCNRVADYGSVNDAEVFEMYLRLFETVSGRFNDDPLRNFMYFKRFFSWNYDLLRALPHEKKEEILEMYCKSLKKIPDQPLGDKLDAYTHIIWFATNYGQNESKKRLIDEAFALLNDASDNPEGLKKSPQISVPLAEIERLSKY